MDPINGISQIMQILRRKLGEQSTDANSKTGTSRQTSPTGQQERSEKPSAEEIQRKIGDRIKALNEDEREGTKATLVFVESVLVWEFGDKLLQDPKFAELSKQVAHTISQDRTASAQMQNLLSELKRN